MFLENVTFVTWAEWPKYLWKSAVSRGTGQGKEKSFTKPKSSPVTNVVPSLDLWQALMSYPSKFF